MNDLNEIWLGIDPGLAILGWAIIAMDKQSQIRLIDYGIIETKKKSLQVKD